MKEYRIVHMPGNGRDVFCAVSNLRTAKTILRDLYEIVAGHRACRDVEWTRGGWRFVYRTGVGIDQTDAWVDIQESDRFTSVKEYRESGLYFVP